MVSTAYWLKPKPWSFSSPLPSNLSAIIVSLICKHNLIPSLFLSFCSYHLLPSHLHLLPGWLGDLQTGYHFLCSLPVCAPDSSQSGLHICVHWTMSLICLVPLSLLIKFRIKISPSSHGLPHSPWIWASSHTPALPPSSMLPLPTLCV